MRIALSVLHLHTHRPLYLHTAIATYLKSGIPASATVPSPHCLFYTLQNLSLARTKKLITKSSEDNIAAITVAMLVGRPVSSPQSSMLAGGSKT
ncbi:hypothetical protein Hanom_Chr15g01345361 [Helianthus anomalus]